ncbi:methyltransferase RsmF C-terminal domain-like protein [Solitalea canadensis]|uniref:tRNA/rRNA cytosine-C5-methylase n=1 Tax=Solitalea canadensis (strain ATCC 29591 / DSM 3403 / JCM 21819 / LMG 8368 / NBRC 15130 / NCIMB 12057 / USAM 9D) TaxID=929556 RepID=H8KXS0_SOLCM|nr:tRNA/rRNA cytosine-C5-methylase [Solitalea canadensis]AFD05485.1 tRNA/rRNA cytosine-C5-methylase [Solitalea canadensis DSM 3403]
MKLPPPFKLRMAEFLGPELEKFIDSLSSESPVSIRVNKNKYPFDIAYKPIPWTTTGYYLPERPSFTADPLLHGGAYYVQEASSMFVEQAVRQVFSERSGFNVLDLCAAPGGKSTHLAALFDEDSLIVSNEVIKSRVTILSENIQKWGTGNVVVTNNDPKDFKDIKGFFDCIVVDAPCSGEGMFRKNESAIDEWSEDNVQLCAQRQRRILADIWSSLKPGGVLIYSTCTYSPNENEENLAWLCENYEAENLTIKLDDNWRIKESTHSGFTGYRFYPHETQGEGFFLAIVRKKGELGKEFKYPKKKGKSLFVPMDAKAIAPFSGLLLMPEKWKYFLKNDMVSLFPAIKSKEVEYLIDALNVIYAGVEVGQLTKKEFRPEHALALFGELNKNYFSVIEVNKETALKFLRKDDQVFEKAIEGWSLLTYNGIGLGWVKKVGNRFNNYYPKEWRIRLSLDKMI